MADKHGKCVDMQGMDFCKKHKKRFKFFCENDKALACSTCAIVSHRRCEEVSEIESIKETVRCNELSKMLRIAITETKTAIENLEEADLRLSDDVTDVEKKLSNLKTQILQSFDDFARNVTHNANTYGYAKKAKWASQKIDCKTKLKDISTTLNTLDTIIEYGAPSQRFVATHSMEGSIQNEIREHNTVCEDLRKLAISIKFSENVEHFKTHIMGKLNPDMFDINYRVPPKSKLNEIASIYLKQTVEDFKEPLYSGLDFTADGRLVAVDVRTCTCLIYDEELHLLSDFKLPFKYPYCVAACAGDKVINTSGYLLNLLQVSQSHKMTLLRTVKVNVPYFSVSMMDDNKAVVSTIYHDTPVRIVSMSGEEKDIDIAFPSNKYPLGKSSCAYIRGKHKLVLTDRDEDTVFIYDMESGERIVVKDELIKEPYGVAVGPYDHVFVGSFIASTSIVEMTHTGHVLLSIDVGIECPRTLCISRDGKRLAVSNVKLGNKVLKLFAIVSE